MKSEDFIHEVTQTGAIFGRKQDVQVVFEGDQAKTDGKEITLPSLPSGIEFDRATIMATRGYLDHEAGHIRHSDMPLVQPYGEAVGQACFGIWNSLEDIWMEQKVMDEYPGARKNLIALQEEIASKELESVAGHPEEFGDNATPNNAGLAIRTLGRKDYAPEGYTEEMLKNISPRFQEWGAKWLEELKTCKNTKEVMNLANRIYELLQQENQMSDSEKGDQPENSLGGEKPEDFTFDPNADFKLGGEAKDKKKGRKPLKGKPQEMGKLITDMLKSEVENPKNKPTGKIVQWRINTTKYDEVYSKTSVNKRTNKRQEELKKRTTADYEQIKGNLSGAIHTMKARLRRALLARERRDWDFGKEFGKLDSKRLVAGVQGSPNVYKVRKDREEYDTSVLLMVDLSGSMSGEKIETAGEAVVAFTECLSGTNIKFSVYGFDHSGREPEVGKGKFHRTESQNILEFKGFSETTRNAKGSIAAIKHCVGGNNADRDAVLWSLHKLKEQPSKRKVLMVLSDGCPAHACSRDLGGYSEGWSIDATKQMVDRAKEFGVECVGIGIQDASVKQIYKNNVVIQRVQDLSGTIFTKLAEILVGGSKL